MSDDMDAFVVKLQSRLGNQLFIYAFYKELERVSGKKCYLDVLDYENPDAELSLEAFNVKFQPADKKYRDLLRTTRLKLRRQIKKIFRINLGYKKNHAYDAIGGFDPSYFSKKTPTYFEGYWQSEKYFEGSKDILRKELTFKNEELFKQNPNCEKIENSNSVSIHFRCGDYLSKPRTRMRFYVCTKGYFDRAISHMKTHLDNPKFFVFTDDHEWVKKNLKFPDNFVFVESNDKFEDLYLMSRCKNNIISNSSFSWWGAWLNNNPEKIVIAPDIWGTPKMKYSYESIVPDSWIRLDSGYGKEKFY